MALGRHIGFVTHEELVDALRGVAVNLLHPLLHIGKTVSVCNVVDDNDSMGASIVTAGDGSETFLSRSIPLAAQEKDKSKRGRGGMRGSYDLELYRFALKLDSSNLEIHSNGGNVGFCISVIGEP